MIWSVMIFTMMVTAGTRWWSQWGFRVTVISSLAANLVLGLLSSTRRRSASGRCASKFHLFLVFILWLAYLIAEAAATSAIGNLSLCGSDVTDDEKHLVAFWAPFLLLHRGGPDNLSAYALEDNKFSLRTSFGMITHISAVIYAIYNSYRGGGSGVLIAASVIVLVSGAVRYGERVYALWKANLDSMKEDVPSSSLSSSDKEKTQRKESSWEQDKMDGLRSSIIEKRMMAEQRKKQVIGDDGEALLLAQDLSPVWRHAIVDSSVEPGSIRQLASEEIIRSLDWESMCRVVEMELSLVYELLYTKAIVAHTWQGYLIRFVSPLAIAAAAWLFWLRGHGGGGGTTRGSFVGISYALLAIAFVQDVAWLLRALGSTWTYDYLQKEQTRAWLRHHALHAGKTRWYSLHYSILRLDPLRLFCVDPVSYRRWSGTIGQYNLLHECTTSTRGQQCPPGWLASLAGGSVKEIQYLSKLPERTKELLFKRVKKILLEAIEHKGNDSNNKAATPDKNKEYADEHYIMVDIRTLWGQKAFHLTRNEKVLFQGVAEDEAEAPRFGREFEEDVLCWHIATCIVLPFIRHQVGMPSSPKSQGHADAIAVMSEYMMFLVAVRREMLPGLVLHSQFEVTQKALVRLWNKYGGAEDIVREKDKKAATDDKEKLAMILRRLRADRVDEDIKHEWEEIQGDEGTRLLVDAVELYRSLKLAGDTPANRHRRKQSGKAPKREQRGKAPKRDRRPPPAEELLEFIFNVWVDKLVYASVRCSREAHAKQLSAGGDLTTVLWMVIQHAGPFRIGEKPIYFKHHKTSADPPPRPQAPPKADPLPPPPPPPLPSPSPPPYYHPVCPWPPPSWAPQWPPQYEKPGDEPPTAPAPLAHEVAIEDEDEDEEDSDEEYNLPIEYVTLY